MEVHVQLAELPERLHWDAQYRSSKLGMCALVLGDGAAQPPRHCFLEFTATTGDVHGFGRFCEVIVLIAGVSGSGRWLNDHFCCMHRIHLVYACAG